MLLVWEKKKKKFSRSHSHTQLSHNSKRFLNSNLTWEKSESTLNGRQTGRLAEELVAFWTVTETGRE